MFNSLFYWLLFAVGTLINFRLFLSRWAEEPHAPFGALLSDRDLVSLAIGVAAVAFLSALIDTLRSFRFFAFILLVGIGVLVLFVTSLLGVDKFMLSPAWGYAGIGALFGLAVFRLSDSSLLKGGANFVRSFFRMALASFNAFLLMAPWTTHVPSYMQDTITNVPRLTVFYYGSVHSDLSPVSIGVRWIINLFFGYQSINATAISSMLYLSCALALAGVALGMIFGGLWGWALLFLAWSDRWLFASAVSSAIIGQPVLSTAYALFLCTWAICRKESKLSWREVSVLGAANASGLFFNLYGYSAARMTWLVGSGVAALILIARRAVWFDSDGYRKVVVALLPSILMLAALWIFVFGMQSDRFSDQLLISPGAAHRIQDVNSYRTKLIEVNDPDMPIWWGTGRPANGENKSLYWKRTPSELYVKVKWLMKEVASQQPIPFVLVFLGGLGLATGIASSVAIRRRFSFALLLLTVISFATFILAQDASAYRRSLATNLLLIVSAVSLFAIRIRGYRAHLIAVFFCGLLAVLKAPAELNALFNESFWSQSCVNCQPLLDIRKLVNDPVFSNLSQQPLRYVVEGQGISPLYGRCAQRAFESYEFKRMAPNSSQVSLGPKSLARVFAEIKVGEVLMVSCSQSVSNDAELASVCSGAAPFGEPLALIPSERKPQERIWWAFVAKR